MRNQMAVLAVMVSAVLAGCAPTALERARFQQGTVIETYPVTIVSVDGAAVSSASTVMAPGPRKVTVQMPSAAGFKAGDVRTIDLEVKSCTRYWLVATRDSRAATDYEVKVDYEKRDHNCARTASN